MLIALLGEERNTNKAGNTLENLLNKLPEMSIATADGMKSYYDCKTNLISTIDLQLIPNKLSGYSKICTFPPLLTDHYVILVEIGKIIDEEEEHTPKFNNNRALLYLGLLLY